MVCNQFVLTRRLSNILQQRQQRQSPIVQRGGINRAIRRNNVISAAPAEPPANTKCQFGGISRASRQTIRRIICNRCEFCATGIAPLEFYQIVTGWPFRRADSRIPSHSFAMRSPPSAGDALGISPARIAKN